MVLVDGYNINDKEWLLMMKTSEFLNLVRDNEKTLKGIAYKYSARIRFGKEPDDIEQDMMEKLWEHRAELTADNFTGYATNYARNAIKTTAKRSGAFNCIELDNPRFDAEGVPEIQISDTRIDIEIEVLENEFTKKMKEEFYSLLSPDERLVLAMRYAGEKHKDINKALGRRCDRIIQSLRRKFEGYRVATQTA